MCQAGKLSAAEFAASQTDAIGLGRPARSASSFPSCVRVQREKLWGRLVGYVGVGRWGREGRGGVGREEGGGAHSFSLILSLTHTHSPSLSLPLSLPYPLTPTPSPIQDPLIDPVAVRMRVHPAHAVDPDAPAIAVEAISALVVLALVELVLVERDVTDVWVLVVRCRANRVLNHAGGRRVQRIGAAHAARALLLPPRPARRARRDRVRALQPKTLYVMKVFLGEGEPFCGGGKEVE